MLKSIFDDRTLVAAAYSDNLAHVVLSSRLFDPTPICFAVHRWIQPPSNPPHPTLHHPQGAYMCVVCCVGHCRDSGSCVVGAVGSIFQGQGVGGGAFASTSSSQEGSSARAELLHGASQPEARGKGGMRSAAEIRSAYGRSGARCGYIFVCCHRLSFCGVMAVIPFALLDVYINRYAS